MTVAAKVPSIALFFFFRSLKSPATTGMVLDASASELLIVLVPSSKEVRTVIFFDKNVH